MEDEHKKHWNDRYVTTKVTEMPWYNPEADDDLVNALDKRKIKSGAFLDLGTGPATQAFQLKKIGFNVTGSDISAEAIRLAKETYPNITFVEDDIVETKLNSKFDYIFDRGCFHTLDIEKRAKYCKNVHNLLNDSGMIFLKCFSNREPEGYGPHRISEEMIRDTFESKFIVDEIYHTVFSKGSRQTKALFVVLQKK